MCPTFLGVWNINESILNLNHFKYSWLFAYLSFQKMYGLAQFYMSLQLITNHNAYYFIP